MNMYIRGALNKFLVALLMQARINQNCYALKAHLLMTPPYKL
jgi:hypothetical protein